MSLPLATRNRPLSALAPFASPLALALVLVLCASGASAQSSRAQSAGAQSWELEKRDAKAGWELFTAPVEGSDHLRYRLIAVSDEPVDRVAQALRLKLRDTRYMPEGYHRKILSSGEDFMLNYVRMEVPVISDRDVVIETRWWTDAATNAYHVTWAPPQGEVPPVPKGVSRIESRGSWEVTPTAAGGSRLVYTQHSELGDSIPTWLIERLMNAQIINEYVSLSGILKSDMPNVAAPPPASGRTSSSVRVPQAASTLAK